MEVAIQYVNPPKEGKKLWSIKDTGGKYYYVAASLGPQLQGKENTTQNFTSKPAPWNAEQTIITGFGNGGGQDPAYEPPGTPAPRQQPTTSANTKSEEMFVMGVVGRSMQSGKFDIEHIGPLTQAARAAWKLDTPF